MHPLRAMRNFIFLLSTACLCGQESRFSFGATGGFSFGSDASTRFATLNQESRKYTIGPSFEYRFTDHVSLVVNPLYRRLGSSYSLQQFAQAGTSDIFGRTRTHNLSLPILGKYTFRPGTEKWRPFITTGYELAKSWNEFETRQVYRDTLAATRQTFVGKSSNRSPLSNGIVIGGGVDYRFRRFYVAPEFRYTFQNPTNSSVEGRHKADLLLSIRF
jgi:hypothetical protein